jgi:hypothetical protein
VVAKQDEKSKKNMFTKEAEKLRFWSLLLFKEN